MAHCNDPLAEIMAEHGDGPRDVEARELLAIVQGRMFSRPVSFALGRYRGLERIGEGGMGIVYSAEDPRLRRRVALKVLRSRSRDEGLDVLREARGLARLSHPNVVQVLDAGVHSDETFVAMELVSGQTLARWLSHTARHWRAIVDAFVQAGRGLAAAHRGGVVHRDFKPSNAIVADDGRVLVTDFGLAIVDGTQATPTSPGDDPSAVDSPSLTGAVVGTLGYAAPEQLRGRARGAIDARADQFALCAALYEALHGVQPFDAGSSDGYEESIRTARFVRPAVGPRIPSRLDRVIARGLAFDAGDRYADMDALVKALSSAVAPRRRWHVFAVSAILLAAAAGWGVTRSPAGGGCADASEGSVQWTEPDRARARRAFVATELTYAGAAFDVADQELTQYATEWTAAYASACAGGDDRQLACLRTRRAGFNTVIGAFSNADARTVEHANRSATSLPSVQECATGTSSPPLDPANHPENQAAQDDLAVAKALVAVGDYPAAERALIAPARVADQLADDRLLAHVSSERGRVAHHLGDLDAAAEHAGAAYYAAMAAGDDKAAALSSSFLLVLAIASGPQPDQAELWERHALAALTRWGGGDPDEAYVHLRLTAYARSQGAVDQARGHAERAVACLDNADPPSYASLSDALTGLGIVLSDQGEYGEAIEVLNRSQRLLARVLPAGHPKFIEGLVSLGVNQISLGALEEAEAAWTKALRLAEGLGPSHFKVGYIAANLGDVAQRLGRYDEATGHLDRAIAVLETALGPEHPALVQPLLSLIDIRLARGEYAAAAALTKRAGRITGAMPGGHPAQTAIAASLAELEWRTGSAEAARTLFEEAIDISTRNAGPDGFAGAGVLSDFGEFLRQQGDLEVARRHLENAIGVVETVRGSDYPDLAYPLTSLGKTLAAVGELGPALDALRRAQRLRSDTRTPTWVRAETDLALADTLWNAGERREALEHAQAAHESCRADEPAARLCLSRVQRWTTTHRGT